MKSSLFKSLKLSLFFFSILTNGFAQTPTPLRSTLGLSGSSKAIALNGGNYIVLQSIGQLSIIGLNQGSNLSMLQGYIQPPLFYTSSSKFDSNTLQASIYPNPFSKTTTIYFSEEIADCLYVNLFDLYGRNLFSNRYSASQELNIDFSNLNSGLYLVKVQSGSKYLTTKLIKE
jgi:hypothetical protein